MVFVSIDGNKEAFERNFKEMPWLAVPYDDDQKISALKQKFGINGIPTMVVVDNQGNEVKANGREDVSKDCTSAYAVWDAEKEKPKQVAAI